MHGKLMESKDGRELGHKYWMGQGKLPTCLILIRRVSLIAGDKLCIPT